ncbi:MAG TPA: SRPBCC family protein [Burkholderiaceae bacterium]|nr:SRPBCC family protein [Burkholderiaceae bacterium]
MNHHHVRIVTHWRIPASAEDVTAIFRDPTDLPRWWPAVYLDVQRVAAGGADDVGATYDLYTKGWLPYTLRWRLRVERVEPLRKVVAAEGGDFRGTGVWTFQPVEGGGEPRLDVSYDWEIDIERPQFKRWAWLLAPVFVANHRWAMAMGERSLVLECARRRASTPQERERIPAPPGPTFMSFVPARKPG